MDLHESNKTINGVLWCVTDAIKDLTEKVCDEWDKLRSELNSVPAFVNNLIPLDTIIKEHEKINRMLQ